MIKKHKLQLNKQDQESEKIVLNTVLKIILITIIKRLERTE